MIIKSKLLIPEKPKYSITRDRLFARNTHYKLNLVYAPAGYGKTTAIVNWAESKKNVAWFQIDKFDDNVSQFYSYFVHALNQSNIISCPLSLKAIRQNQSPNLIDLFSTLLNELSEFNYPLTLVLDNYQHIHNPDIHQGIVFFIKNMPEQWEVVISSRTIPPISVSNLRIKQQLFEITEVELAFTLSEADTFFSQCTTFYRDSDIQKSLCQNVDGWAIALQLVSILSKDSDSFTKFAQLIGEGNHAYLWDYLEDEVFSNLSIRLQSLLVAIAPLNRIDANIVNELCDIEDAQEQLALLQELLTFVIPTSDRFTFHSFFKAFLIHKNEQESDIKGTHKKIAQLWFAQNEIEESVPHAVMSQDEQLLIDILLKTGWRLFNNGQLNNLRECFAFIKDKIWSYPKLILLKAWMLQNCHQGQDVLPLIEKAKRRFEQQKITLSPQQVNEFAIIQAQISINQGKIEKALQQAETTLPLAEENTARVNILAQTIIGEAHKKIGNLPLAYQYFQTAKQLADQQSQQQNVIWSLYQQAEILETQNNHHNAERHIDAAISLVNKYQLQKLPLYTYLLHFKVQQAYEQGDFKLVEHLCEHALRILLPYGEQWCLYTYTLQANLAFSKDEQDKAAQLITEIEKPIHNQSFYCDWRTASDYVRIQYWRLNNDVESIELWLNNNQPMKSAFNPIAQAYNRNRVCALIQQNELQLAQQFIEYNLDDAQQSDLKTELNRNLILLSCIKSRLQQIELAKAYLNQAIELSLQTGLTISFIQESKDLAPIFQELIKTPSINNKVKEKLIYLLSLSGIPLHEAPKVPFDLASVIKIQAHSKAPRLIKNISLTPREWQVLGFIHLKYSNQQIAKAIAVAPTTVKSHIRNIYQKLGLENRDEALLLSSELIGLLGERNIQL